MYSRCLDENEIMQEGDVAIRVRDGELDELIIKGLAGIQVKDLYPWEVNKYGYGTLAVIRYEQNCGCNNVK